MLPTQQQLRLGVGVTPVSYHTIRLKPPAGGLEKAYSKSYIARSPIALFRLLLYPTVFSGAIEARFPSAVRRARNSTYQYEYVYVYSYRNRDYGDI